MPKTATPQEENEELKRVNLELRKSLTASEERARGYDRCWHCGQVRAARLPCTYAFPTATTALSVGDCDHLGDLRSRCWVTVGVVVAVCVIVDRCVCSVGDRVTADI